MSGSDNGFEKDVSDSDDGFEVVDPESEDDPEGFKFLSRSSFAGNAGTIIFCHLHDEYRSIEEVKCEYIRPEGWTEREEDVVAIFEVGWMNVDEAVAKLPVDLTISLGFPIGSVNLSEFAFREEDYPARAAAVGHFQFCYLRGGTVLGASTPFTIRGRGSAIPVPQLDGKPLLAQQQFVFGRTSPVGGDKASSKYSETDSASPMSKQSDGDVGATRTYPAMESASANSKNDSHFAEHDIADGWNAASIKQSLPSLSQYEMSHCIRESEWKRQQESEQLEKLQKAEEELQLVKEEMSLREAELGKKLRKAEGELQLVKDEMSSKEAELCEKLRKAEDELQLLKEMSLREAELGKKLRKAEEELQLLKKDMSLREAEQVKRMKNSEDELQALKEKMSFREAEHVKMLGRAAEERDTVILDLAARDALYIELRKELVDAITKMQSMRMQLADTEDYRKQLQQTKVVSDSATLSLQEEQEIVIRDLKQELTTIREGLCLDDLHKLNKQIQKLKQGLCAAEENLRIEVAAAVTAMREMAEELALKDMNHKNYVAEAEKEKRQTEALAAANAAAKAQIQRLQDEAKLYKSKLGETIVELTNTKQQADSLKEQCAQFVEDFSVMESNKKHLLTRISTLKEELDKKEVSGTSADAKHDVLVQEFMKKSEELNVAKQQMKSFQEELSRLNAQRTALMKDLQEAQRLQQPARCEKACCAFEITPGADQPENVVESVLEALEQSHQQNKVLENQLGAEKKRAQDLEGKLQAAAGKQRSLFMEKVTLEARLKELLGSD